VRGNLKELLAVLVESWYCLGLVELLEGVSGLALSVSSFQKKVGSVG